MRLTDEQKEIRRTVSAFVEREVSPIADVNGPSILSGAHETLSRRVIELLRAHGLDIAKLRAIGIADVFGQEATLDEVVARVSALASPGGYG